MPSSDNKHAACPALNNYCTSSSSLVLSMPCVKDQSSKGHSILVLKQKLAHGYTLTILCLYHSNQSKHQTRPDTHAWYFKTTQQISSISKYNYFGIKGRLSRNNVRTLCTCIMYGTDPVPVCTRTDSNGSKTKYRYCWCRYHFVNWYRYGTLDNNFCNFCTHILKKLYKIQLRKSYRYLFTSFKGFLNQYFELFRK